MSFYLNNDENMVSYELKMIELKMVRAYVLFMLK
jgi:hypothetical protein